MGGSYDLALNGTLLNGGTDNNTITVDNTELTTVGGSVSLSANSDAARLRNNSVASAHRYKSCSSEIAN